MNKDTNTKDNNTGPALGLVSNRASYKAIHGYSKTWAKKVRDIVALGTNIEDAEAIVRGRTKQRKSNELKNKQAKHHKALAGRGKKGKTKFLKAPSGKEKKR